MIRIALAGVLALALSACSVAPRDAPQAAYEGTVAFAAALKGANAYAAMPRCSATIKPPCSQQAVVDKIIVYADRADAAVRGAQTVSKDTKSSDTDVQKAVNAANDAIRALTQIIPAT